MNPPIAEKDKWLAFDFEQTQSGDDYWGMFNLRVANDYEGGNSERTEITFDTSNHGGNEMQLVVETFDHKGPSAHVIDSGRFTVTLYGGVEASAFFEAMRRLVAAYDLRVKLGR